MSNCLFQLENVAFRYARSRPEVLSGFSRRFSVGLSLLQGPSGGGKSTLLKLLAGYLSPTAGRIATWLGKAPDSAFARTEVGFVFQQFNLLPSATVRENLLLAASAAGMSDTHAIVEADRWLTRLGIERLAHVAADTLSGGQLQRASLARALIKSPAVLLLDEPTSGLDEANTDLIAGVIGDWCASGRSVIASTHDPRLTARLPQADILELAAA